MRRMELLLAGVAVALVGFVAASAVRQRREAPVTPRAAPADADAGAGDAGPASVATPDTAAYRDAGADHAEVRRRIVAAGETWMPDLLAETDSVLFRWPDHQREALRVWIDRAPALPRWDPQYAAMAALVFDEWRTAGFPMRFLFVPDSASAQLRITWIDRFPEPRQLGNTIRLARTNGWIEQASVAVATVDAHDAPLPPALVRATVRHEVGHALGLGHVRDSASVMYPNAYTLDIGPRDRATLRLLYALPAGSVK
ncbi:MAG TPA: matrixin family metalloprotease [Gemmatimonadaceae bacterium]